VPWWNIDYVHVDHAQIMYHAKAWHAGRIPYRDDWLHHFCGYVIPVYLLGFLFPIGPGLLKGLCIGMKLLTALINARTAYLLAGRSAAVLAAFLTVSMGMFFAWQGNILNAQGFQEPLLAMMLYYVLRAGLRGECRSLCQAAAAWSVLVLVDQRALVFGSLLVISLVFHPQLRALRSIALTVLAGSVCPIVACGILWYLGAWQAFWEQTIIYPLRYRNQGVSQFGSMRMSVIQRLRIFALLETPAVLFACAGALAILCKEKRRIVVWVFVIALASALVYMLAGGRLYTNYALIASPILILSCALLPNYVAADERRRMAAAAYAVVIVTAIVSWLPPFWSMGRNETVYFSGDESVARDVARTVRDESPANADVLVWGYKPQVYLHADRLSWFRDMSLISVAGGNFRSTRREDQGMDPEMLAEFRRRLEESAPEIIVYYEKKRVSPTGRYVFGRGEVQDNMDFRRNDHLKFLADKLDREYASWKVFESPIERAEIYRRIDSESAL
jgi:hypothetical protein